MRKIARLLVLLLLALGAFAAQAKPIADMTRLAADMPSDTVAFASLRLDGDYIAELDAVLAQIGQFVPLGGATLAAQLDDFARLNYGEDFETSIGSWLGDTAAIGLRLNADLMDNSEPPIIVVAEISDAAAARAFFEAMMTTSSNDYEIVEIDGGVQFQYVEEWGDITVITLTDDRLIIHSQTTPSPLNLETSLADVANFNTTAANMPTDDYNIFTYLDFAAVYQTLAQTLQAEGDPSAGLLTSLSGTMGTMALGFTILDGNTLTIEAVQITDPEAARQWGTELMNATIDPAFAQNVPADAPLVIHGGDFGASIQASLDSIRGLQAYIDSQGGWGKFVGLPESELRNLETQIGLQILDLDALVATTNISFSGLTGISLQRDFLPRIGDAAVFMRIIPVNNPFTPIFPDMGIALQANAEDAAFLFDALVAASQAYDAGYAVEDADGGRIMNVTALSELLQMLPLEGFFDVLVGAGDDVLVMGTQAAVRDVLAGNETLADTADFQDAANYVLPDANMVMYIATQPLIDNITTLLEVGELPEDAVDTLRFVRTVLPVLRHSTLSTSLDAETGVYQMRATLTLGER